MWVSAEALVGMMKYNVYDMNVTVCAWTIRVEEGGVYPLYTKARGGMGSMGYHVHRRDRLRLTAEKAVQSLCNMCTMRYVDDAGGKVMYYSKDQVTAYVL